MGPSSPATFSCNMAAVINVSSPRDPLSAPSKLLLAEVLDNN